MAYRLGWVNSVCRDRFFPRSSWCRSGIVSLSILSDHLVVRYQYLLTAALECSLSQLVVFCLFFAFSLSFYALIACFYAYACTFYCPLSPKKNILPTTSNMCISLFHNIVARYLSWALFYPLIARLKFNGLLFEPWNISHVGTLTWRTWTVYLTQRGLLNMPLHPKCMHCCQIHLQPRHRSVLYMLFYIVSTCPYPRQLPLSALCCFLLLLLLDLHI